MPRLPSLLSLLLPLLLMVSLWLPAGPAAAHFQMLIPTTDRVTQAADNPLTLQLMFTHPMTGGPAMPMAAPLAFQAFTPAGRQDLLPQLEPVQYDGQAAFRTRYRLTEPGNHRFVVTPAPYWEPAEGVWIQHLTQVVVDGFDGGGDWHQPLGLPVEIRPLSQPYGLWTGNLLRGQVLRDGQPVPGVTVEVAWWNDGAVPLPADAALTQEVVTDAQGIFAYALPHAGWWGFAALLEGGQTRLAPDGRAAPVELGALLWVHARDLR